MWDRRRLCGRESCLTRTPALADKITKLSSSFQSTKKAGKLPISLPVGRGKEGRYFDTESRQVPPSRSSGIPHAQHHVSFFSFFFPFHAWLFGSRGNTDSQERKKKKKTYQNCYTLLLLLHTALCVGPCRLPSSPMLSHVVPMFRCAVCTHTTSLTPSAPPIKIKLFPRTVVFFFFLFSASCHPRSATPFQSSFRHSPHPVQVPCRCLFPEKYIHTEEIPSHTTAQQATAEPHFTKNNNRGFGKPRIMNRSQTKTEQE